MSLPFSPFPVENLPYGVFSHRGPARRVGVALGDQVVDLAALEARGLLGPTEGVFGTGSLNAFMARGSSVWASVRSRLTDLLTARTRAPAVREAFVSLSEATLHLPFEVADYVDFYSSLNHAYNVGRIFRPGSEPLTPNWRHLPIGYHGRSGTVLVSGTPVVRPCGQRQDGGGGTSPTFGPSTRLDIECEVGFVVGVGAAIGHRVQASNFAEHVFGAVLLNDWSARDIQAWESAPLGPFLGKSFATSVSPWVVPLAALADARVALPEQDPPPLPYLRDHDPWSLDLSLSIALNDEVVSRPPFASMYWSPGQQLAHLTVNGASLRTGDLYGSGTVSGPAQEQWGSLLELTWNGTAPLRLRDGSTRAFLQDGDTVSITASARGAGGVPIGFGSVEGTIMPAIQVAS
jgi:fumarylacetoacetase